METAVFAPTNPREFSGYAPYRLKLRAMTDEELTQEEDRQRAGFLACEGMHGRTNPRYALYVDAWELTQWEWQSRNERRELFAAIAR